MDMTRTTSGKEVGIHIFSSLACLVFNVGNTMNVLLSMLYIRCSYLFSCVLSCSANTKELYLLKRTAGIHTRTKIVFFMLLFLLLLNTIYKHTLRSLCVVISCDYHSVITRLRCSSYCSD